MNASQYSKLIENFNSLNQENLEKLEKLSHKYPYCQNIYAYYLKSLKDQKKYNFDYILRKTSILTLDREQLYNWLYEIKDKKTIPVNNDNNEIEKSFFEWINLTNTKTESNTSKIELSNNSEIIDSFINKNPKMPKIKDDLNIESGLIDANFNKEEFMTETLAKMYVKQKKYDSAIRAFKILSLNYPEKKSLFAIQIKKIKKLIKFS
ncbi:MAG: hypothetical protein P8M03_03900 [Flavobacteriaceae bacterium]|nr:hypothetical protein [Flavobacteriaceae bacterium]